MDNSGAAPKVEGAVASGGTSHRHNAAPGAANPSAAAAAASGSSTGNEASSSAPVASIPAHPSSVAPAPAPGSLDVATQKFKGGIGSFQALIDGLVASVAKEKEELQGSRDQLNLDKAEFEQEKARVNQVLNDNEQVSCLRLWCAGMGWTSSRARVPHAGCYYYSSVDGVLEGAASTAGLCSLPSAMGPL